MRASIRRSAATSASAQSRSIVVGPAPTRLLPALVPASIRFTRYAGSPGIGTPSGIVELRYHRGLHHPDHGARGLVSVELGHVGRERCPVGHGPSAPRFLVGPRPDDVANRGRPLASEGRAALFSFPHRGSWPEAAG